MCFGRSAAHLAHSQSERKRACICERVFAWVRCCHASWRVLCVYSLCSGTSHHSVRAHPCARHGGALTCEYTWPCVHEHVCSARCNHAWWCARVCAWLLGLHRTPRHAPARLCTVHRVVCLHLPSEGVRARAYVWRACCRPCGMYACPWLLAWCADPTRTPVVVRVCGCTEWQVVCHGLWTSASVLAQCICMCGGVLAMLMSCREQRVHVRVRARLRKCVRACVLCLSGATAPIPCDPSRQMRCFGGAVCMYAGVKVACGWV